MPSSGVRSNRAERKNTSDSLNSTQAPSLAPSQYSWDSTVTPSADATGTPTPSPLAEPTVKPSSVPTHAPSAFPTHLPYVYQTIWPSSAPPTKAPSIYPTDSPSEGPTDSPSIDPTDSPSIDPTNLPSIEPTDSPSIDPTNSPSLHPTLLPSARPTYTPSLDPTQAPTTNPTQQRETSMKIYIRVLLPLGLTLLVAFVLVWCFVKKRNRVLKHYREINTGTMSTDLDSSVSNVSLVRTREESGVKLSYRSNTKKKLKNSLTAKGRSSYVSLMDSITGGYGSVSSP